MDGTGKIRLATAWLGGCSGCHMSFLDLGEELIGLQPLVELVYGPLVDAKEFPEGVDLALVEGAVANRDHLDLVERIRARSRVLVSLGDCAVTGNVTALRNCAPLEELFAAACRETGGRAPAGTTAGALPALLPRVLPLHRVVAVDAFIPGCPPDAERISAALSALLRGELPALGAERLTFG